jgi:hypothetical protein
VEEIRRRGLKTDYDLTAAFGVSMEAARIRIDRLKRSGEM